MPQPGTVVLCGTGPGTGVARHIAGGPSRCLITAPVARGGKVIWPRPGEEVLLRAAGEPEEAAARARVAARALKPMPLLAVEPVSGRLSLLHPAGRLVTVTSGKGGTGKSTAAALLAAAFARRGLRTALADADLGSADLAFYIGFRPERGLADVMNGGTGVLEVAARAPGGYWFVRGTPHSPEWGAPGPWQLARLAAALAELQTGMDVTLADTGAGVSSAIHALLLASPEILVVMGEDAASVMDAYAVLKVLRGLGAGRPVWLLVSRASDAALAGERAARFAALVRDTLGLRLAYLPPLPEDAALRLAAGRGESRPEIDRICETILGGAGSHA